MATLTITLDEKLSFQIREAAKARGAEADTMAVDALKQAFGGSAQEKFRVLEQSAIEQATSEQFLAFLAPVWAETRCLSSASGSLPEEEAGDIHEAKLAQYYAEDYDRAQERTP